MNENATPNAGPLRNRDIEQRTEPCPSNGNGAPRPQPTPVNGHKAAPKVSFWTALDLLADRWHWLVLGILVGAGCFYMLGWTFIKSKYVATGQLLRYEAPGKSEYFKTTPVSADTFAATIRAPELLQELGQHAVPPVPWQTVNKLIKIDPDSDSDMIKVQLVARDPQQAVDLLNLFLTNAVEYTRQIEAQEAAVLANEYLSNQVAAMDRDLSDVQNQFRQGPLAGLATNRLARVGEQVSAVGTNLAVSPRPSMINMAQQAEALTRAQGELYDLLQKYKDDYPLVQAKRQQIDELEQSAATNGNLAGMAFSRGTGHGGEAADPQLDFIQIKLRAVADARVELTKRQREAEMYAVNPPGSVRVFSTADLTTVKGNMRRVKIGAVTIFGGAFGLMAAILMVCLVEFVDNRLKSADDVTRVTHLPVLTTLGNLREMDPKEREQWAFRTWTMLQGRLSPSANHGLVCGVTSSAPGEGRSTWISLLAEAASLTGFRVLTIATRPSPLHMRNENDFFGEVTDEPIPEGAETSSSLTTSVLSSPGAVTEQLTGPNSQPVVHIPLPGWVWNLERRKQWREALNHWRTIDNLVILVELPPASVPEAVLLGSHLPNLLWLTDSANAKAGETRAQLSTLRDARCNLVGAVLNRTSSIPIRKRFPRWIECATVLAAVGISFSTHGQAVSPLAVPAPQVTPPATEEPATNASFSIMDPSQRAPWQEHLTLGAGDVLTFGLFGQPELTKAEIAIGPDGRVNYLEATNVMAAGLTIDEFRARMDEELGKYRRAPHTLITPVVFKSKKYYVLGMVATKGVFVLDRPLTVLEALGRAHGLENALVDRNVYDLADFHRSFLARAGKRYPLDFERLFERGDLSQNIAIEPGDYLYFASADVSEVYVVGEIRLPGAVTYHPDLTIMGAITERGGYTARSYKARVIVVRGSLKNPDKFVVNTHAVLDGTGPDFQLKPRDIIYVNSRPFIRVEEAADLAITAFIQSVIASWVGVDVLQPFPIQ
jgi:protein involved in polysaccharide export with SLBB domain/capsular polysaccharide biosynthesis protein